MAVDAIARALAAHALSGSDRDSTGILVGVVDQNSTMPTSRPDGSALENEDYVKTKPNATFPFTINGITFENKFTKAIYFNNDWIVDVGLIQDTSETPVLAPTAESYSKVSDRQSKINKENVGLFKEIKDALPPAMMLESDKELIKKGAAASITLHIKVEKGGTDIKSIAILRNDISINEKTDSVALGAEYTYNDSISATANYKIKVVDIDNRVFVSDVIEVIAVDPAYKASVSNPTAWVELPLHKDANAKVEYNFEYDGAIYKYPKSFGQLTSILACSDGMSYENYLDSFEVSEDGDYYVYTMKNKCRLVNYEFNFVKQ